MKLILDTHAFIWAMAEPERLGVDAAAAIGDRSNELLVSAASAWEVATKHRIGKLPQGAVIAAGFTQALAALPAAQLPISVEHGLAAGALVGPHRDPFDRMLAAQAMIEGAALVTSDRAFDEFPVTVLW